MNVKGIAWLVRREFLVHEFGEDAHAELIAELHRDDPAFEEQDIASSKGPIEPFLKYNDYAIRRFYDGDLKTYLTFGRIAADYHSSHPPYQSTFFSTDYHEFLHRAPVLWEAVFDDGRVEITDGEVVDLKVLDTPVHHVYFEYFIVAFVERGMEILRAPLFHHERITGFSKGDSEVHYRFLHG